MAYGTCGWISGAAVQEWGSGMPWNVAFDESLGVVTVKVWGQAQPAEHWAAQTEAMRLCREKRCSRLLVDLRELSTALSTTMDCLDFGQELARKAPALRIAHVVPGEARSKADVRFTSTVEANRGVVAREFATVEEARAWLLEKAPRNGGQPAPAARHGKH